MLAAFAAVLASQTAFASGGPTIPSRHTGGYVPARGAQVGPAGNNNLTYHGGPVMRTNTTYAIYWQPTGYAFSANYKTLINRYFADAAAASGANTNVYSVLNQYYDTTGPIGYTSTFGGSVTDTHPFPTIGNPKSCGGPSKCLTDAQLQTELQSVIAQQGWTRSLTTQFFMFTPNNVGSCASGGCSYTAYCAYHGYGAANLIYANQPYAAYSVGCRSGQRPNADPADDTINVTSHEHREAINDEHLNAWYNDFTGNEGSDQCAWNFGTILGGGQGAEYNQVINNHNYYVQQEWSNDGSTCLLRYGGGGPPPAPTVSSFNPTTGPEGTNVSITGSHFTGVSVVKFNGTSASFTFNSDTSVSATVPNGATTGPIAVTTPNGTGTSAASFTVTGGGGGNPPTVSAFNPASGPVGTNVSITGTGFTGVSAVKFNGTSASFTFNSDTSVSATVPNGATTGPIAVTTPNGTGTSNASFMVTTSGGAPKIAGFSPGFGATGSTILITGSGFTGVSSVTLGGVSTTFTVQSAGRIAAKVPSMAAGSYKWSVTTGGGTATSASYFLHL